MDIFLNKCKCPLCGASICILILIQCLLFYTFVLSIIVYLHESDLNFKQYLEHKREMSMGLQHSYLFIRDYSVYYFLE